jgi:cysteine-rich repeat protein
MRRALYAIPATSLLLLGCQPVCGDGKLDEGEECDDGNAVDTDDCPSSCVNASCGDSFVQSGVEECDDANDIDTDACTNDCTNAECGDGIVFDQAGGVEECDDGNNSDTDDCPSTCENATCGDGFVQAGVEECDDNNQNNNDGCLNICDLDPIVANFEIATHENIPTTDVASFQLCTAGSYYGCYTYTSCSRAFSAPLAVNAALAASGSYSKTRVCVDTNFSTTYNTPEAISGTVDVITSGASYSISLTEGAQALTLDCTMDANLDLACTDNNDLNWVLQAQ